MAEFTNGNPRRLLNLLLFSQGFDGYTLLANITNSDPPVIVADSKNEVYADFWRMQTGGGAPQDYTQAASVHRGVLWLQRPIAITSATVSRGILCRNM